jgi:hypothetical protein
LRAPFGAAVALERPAIRPRWRQGDPHHEIRRLGKKCGAVLDALEAAGGTAAVHELAASLKRARARDLKRRLDMAGYCCQLCDRSGRDVQLDVHHRTYENYGQEKLEDLIVLCRRCHAHHHSVDEAS